MYRMEVSITAESELFTPDSLEFLKEYELYDYDEEALVKYDGNALYDYVVNNLMDSSWIYSESWSFDTEEVKPEDLFSALVNHFKDDCLKITVTGDPEMDYETELGIYGYSTPYYSFAYDPADYTAEDEKEMIENGYFRLIFDFDYLYVSDEEGEEEYLVGDLGGEQYSLY